MISSVWISHSPRLTRNPCFWDAPSLTHLLLIYAEYEVDYEFAAYSVRVEYLYCEVDDLVMYLIVMCNEKTSVGAAQRVTHQKYLHATVAFVLGVRWVNVVTSTYKFLDSVKSITVPLTVVACTLIQAPVCLVHRKRRFLKAPWLLTIPWSFASFLASWFLYRTASPL